jgi:hypothetical protein
MSGADQPDRVALSVPLATVGASSPGRARLALVVWAIGLAGIAWVGMAGHDAGSATPPAAAAVGAIPAATTAGAATTSPTAAPVSRGTVRSILAPVLIRHTLGEDGLVGGIVFGDNVPPAKIQAEVERDGYRRYHVP